MKLPSIFLLCFLILNCKDKPEEKELLGISITLKLLEEDTIKLYYILDEQSTYNEKNSIEVKIKGSLELQNIEFSLEQVPYKFRIDIGDNKKLSSVYFSTVIIGYKNKFICIDDKTIHRFFKSNIYASLSDNGYLRKEVNNRYDPFIESTALLQKKMQIEF